MENLTVELNGQIVEIRYPYYILKKIERENSSIFALAKPSIENTEKLVAYGLAHAAQEVEEADIEQVMGQLIAKEGVMQSIMRILKNYMKTLDPKMDVDKIETQELDEQGLAQVNNIVSGMFGV